MAIQITNDAELRNLIFDNPKVIVKFTKTDCPICEKMGRIYEKLSHKKEFDTIKFLLMDASENPVSSKEVN
ncbi:MAG TPA: thioredoxin family protein, partial [Adhaeribacter sp.]|nr:thioredoxin family protein [Adhaeribacter sp.]